MPLPWERQPAGRIDHHVVSSRALVGNPLGDPSDRPLWVYVPPGYDDDSAKSYPSVYVLQGYTGYLNMWANRSAYRLPFTEAADELFAKGSAPPCIVVYVDAWTAYGGSQFVDSPGTGRYHSYLCEDVVPFVDSHYRTCKEASHRGIQGKSSGGFGAMITPMLRRTCSAAWRPTPATPCTSFATSRSSPRPYEHFVSTRVRSTAGGRTFRGEWRSPRSPMTHC